MTKYARTTRMWLATSGILLLPVAESQAQFLPASRFERPLPTTVTEPPSAKVAHSPAPARASVEGSPSRLVVVADSARRRPSYARHALWGAGIGTALGLGAGMYSYRSNNSDCHDCWVPDEAVLVAGAVVGATVGFVLGSIVYLGARSAAAAGR